MATDNQPGDKNVSTPSLAQASGADSSPSPVTPSTSIGTTSAPTPPKPVTPVSTTAKPPVPPPGKPATPPPAPAVPSVSSTPTPQPAPALPVGADSGSKDAEIQGKMGAKVQGDQQVSPGAVSEDTGVDNPLKPFSKPAEGTKRYTVAASAGRKFWFDGTSLRPGDTVYLTDEQAKRAAHRVEPA